MTFAERAYIVSCKAVLPSGMLGLMVAALFAATASMMSAQLNVFSGVLTNDIYKPLVKNPTEKGLVFAGRVFTVLIGLVIAFIAIMIPHMGGVEKLIISAAQVMAVPILAPVLIALLSRKLGASSLWTTVGICFPLGMLSVGIENGWFTNSALNFLTELKGKWFVDKTLIGVILPVIVTLSLTLISKGKDKGWDNIMALQAREEKALKTKASPMPLLVVAWSMLVFTIMMIALTLLDSEERAVLAVFAIILASISGASFWALKRVKDKYAREAALEAANK